MSLGPVMVGLAGAQLLPEEVDMLRHPMVGGVILFTRNYENPAQLEQLIQAIHDVRQPRLLVAVDHEGGRVQRFRDGFALLPPAGSFGRIYDHDPKRGLRLAETAGWVMAAELRAVGVDFSFAPVLDVAHGVSEVIGDRAFHQRPRVVADLAHSYMTGMHKAGMAAVGKHYPGHGAVAADTHHSLASDPRDLTDIEVADLTPFGHLIHAGVEGLMAAHVVYPRVDAQPAGFSAFWLWEVLRRRLGFQGVIFSDDLLMAGARMAGDVSDRAQAALAAGCDMVLICNDFAAICRSLDHLQRFDNPASHLRLARMHGRKALSRVQLHNDPRWPPALAALAQCEEANTLDLL